MKNSLILLLLFSFWAFNGYSQGEKVINIQIGMNFQNLLDQGHSPLVYTGAGVSPGFSFYKKNDSKLHGLSFQIMGANLEARLEKAFDYQLNSASRQAYHFSWFYMKKLPTNRVNIYLGGKAAILYDLVNYNHQANNPTGYELSISVNPAIYADYPIASFLTVSIEGDIALLAYNTRPYPLGLFPLEDFDVDMNEVLFGGSLVSFNKVFQVHSRATLEWKLKHKQVNLFFDFQGGINTLSERREYTFSQVGLEIPLFLK